MAAWLEIYIETVSCHKTALFANLDASVCGKCNFFLCKELEIHQLTKSDVCKTFCYK